VKALAVCVVQIDVEGKEQRPSFDRNGEFETGLVGLMVETSKVNFVGCVGEDFAEGCAVNSSRLEFS
jgi:hypothetical protein